MVKRVLKKSIPTTQELETEANEFERWYQELQQTFQVLDFHEQLSSLVTGVENKNYPIHSWYSLKEAFSINLPLWILDHIKKAYNADINRVLDPFVGGGTTGVTLAQNN